MAKMYNKNWSRDGVDTNNAEGYVDDFVLESPIDNTITFNDLEFIFEGNIDNSIPQFVNDNDKSVYENVKPHINKAAYNFEPVPPSIEEDISISTVDITKSISKVSNMIRDSLKFNADVYTSVYHGNIQSSDFYIKLGNSIWQSLLELFNITRSEAQDPDYVFQPQENQKYTKTLQFLDRIYHDTRVSLLKDPVDAITNYNEIFYEDGGITSDWLSFLKDKIEDKMDFLSTDDITIILNSVIAFAWCYEEEVDSDDEYYDCGSSTNDDDDDDTDDMDYDDDDNCDANDYDDDGDDMDAVLYVELNNDDNVDDTIVTITSWKGLSSTMYANLNNIDISSVDGRPLDWLRHFIPNAVTITEETELFMSLNDDIDELKFVKLANLCDITDEKNDRSALIGIYNIDYDLINMTDIEIQRLSILVEDSMSLSPAFSHLQRTLEMEQLIVSEDVIIEYLSDIVEILDADDDEEDDNANTESDSDQDILDYAASLVSNQNKSIETIDEPKVTYEGEDDYYENEYEEEYEDEYEEFNEEDIEINEYLINSDIDDEEVVFAPIRKNKDSRYKDIQ